MFKIILKFSDISFDFLENNLKCFFSLDFLSIIDIFIPQGGESIIPHLLCCDAFAVQEYSFIRRRLASEAF